MLLVRRGLLVVGILAVLAGLVWIGQGTGYFPYPAESFMIGQKTWMYRGIALAIAGVAALGASRQI